MNEGFPQNDTESQSEKLFREKIAIASELFESGEKLPFPGIKPEEYEKMKATDEEFPGLTTPIADLNKRFEKEGIKVVLGKNPESGNVFVLPADSDDIETDSIFPRHLLATEDMDERLRRLILKDSQSI